MQPTPRPAWAGPSEPLAMPVVLGR